MLTPLDVLGSIALDKQLKRLSDNTQYVLVSWDDAPLRLILASVAADTAGRPRPDNVTTDDIHGGLGLIASERKRLDEYEVLLIEAALDRGESLSDLAKVYAMTRQALAKRYYALGGQRRPLVGEADRVAAPGTTVRYWMAHTEADLHTDAAVEVTLYYNGIRFRPEVPSSIAGTTADPAVYIAELPRPGTTVTGRVYNAGKGGLDDGGRADVWIRAEVVTDTP